MVKKIVEIADTNGYTGIKRAWFYIIAPFVYVAAFAVGFSKAIVEHIINEIQKD